MNGQRLGRLHRLLRHRAGFTQAELSARCDVARWKIVKLEVGALNDLDFGDAERLLGALDARLEVRAWYHGAAGDRRYGWQCRVEVSFADYGERGSIDLLGWHAATRTLVGEKIKSELGAIEGTLRPLDMKCCLAPKIPGSSSAGRRSTLAASWCCPRIAPRGARWNATNECCVPRSGRFTRVAAVDAPAVRRHCRHLVPDRCAACQR